MYKIHIWKQDACETCVQLLLGDLRIVFFFQNGSMVLLTVKHKCSSMYVTTLVHSFGS